MGKQNETRGNERNMQNVSYAISYRHFFISSSDWQNVERFGGRKENKEKKLAHLIIRNCSSTFVVVSCKFRLSRVNGTLNWNDSFNFSPFSLVNDENENFYVFFCCFLPPRAGNSLIQKNERIKAEEKLPNFALNLHSVEQKLFHFTELYSFQFTFYNFSA